jgi:repressor LexA
MLELYKNIKKYRIMHGWSQEELAKKANYTDRSSIAKIEKGDIDLPQSKIMQFAEIFDVSAGELMGTEGLSSETSEVSSLIRSAAREMQDMSEDDQSFVVNMIKMYKDNKRKNN